MPSSRHPWVPRSALSSLGRRRQRAPRSLGELDGEILGPDARYQDHGPGCDCGNVECPYWRGEEAARRYHRLSEREKQAQGREAAELLKGYFGDA
jgi:hypothetical protein